MKIKHIKLTGRMKEVQREVGEIREKRETDRHRKREKDMQGQRKKSDLKEWIEKERERKKDKAKVIQIDRV